MKDELKLYRDLIKGAVHHKPSELEQLVHPSLHRLISGLVFSVEEVF